jgi:hypothetical protein
MSKIMHTIANSVKILGLAAIMFALAGAALAAPSASAASIGPIGVGTATNTGTVVGASLSDPAPAPVLGKLNLLAVDAAKGASVSGATVVVYDANAVVVTKALTDANGSFATYLAPGTYKVKIFANGYKEFATVITITADQATTVKAGLKTVNSFRALYPNN